MWWKANKRLVFVLYAAIPNPTSESKRKTINQQLVLYFSHIFLAKRGPTFRLADNVDPFFFIFLHITLAANRLLVFDYHKSENYDTIYTQKNTLIYAMSLR